MWAMFYQWPNFFNFFNFWIFFTFFQLGICTMRKYKVLQLGLQLGFLVAIDTYNSWYLYNLECYQTSYNGHFMLYTILYIRCNSQATICNFFATNIHIIFPHTFQCGISSICQQMTYVNTFCNLVITILQLIW
jgi:hypothetical protein